MSRPSAPAVTSARTHRNGHPATAATAARPANGRRAAADHRPQGVIPLLIDAARHGEEFTVWGDGQACKDFLFHTDMSAAVDAALRTRLRGTYNLCAGASHSVAEIIGTVERQTGRTLSRRYAPVEAYPWDVTHSRLDNARLRAALDWQPRIGLEEGIARTVAALAEGD